MHIYRSLFQVCLLICLALPNQFIKAQNLITAEDYARAEQTLYQSTRPLVYNLNIRPVWVDGERFWYRHESKEGYEYRIVNARSEQQKPAFDHTKIAEGLSEITGKTYEANKLPFRSFGFSNDEKAIEFSLGKQDYRCNRIDGTCEKISLHPYRDRMSIESPDGSKAAFIRDYNLWVRDLSNGAETQLTTDGIKDFGYATNNAGWIKSDRPVLTWSP
ncbi:MAG: DPP IV N-terminal domain-containing protein, partial [Bacteroidota bacterium]